MPRYPIYANDFGQLGNNLQQEAAMQQRAIEVAQQNFMRAREQQQQQQNYDRQMAFRQKQEEDAMRRQAVIDAQNERYLNYQMGAGSAASRLPAGVISETHRRALEEARTTGNPVPQSTRAILGEDLSRSIDAEAMAARPSLRRQYGSELDIANTENLRSSTKKRLAEATKNRRGIVMRTLDWLNPTVTLPEEQAYQDALLADKRVSEGYPLPSRADLTASTQRGARGRYNPEMDIQPWLEAEMARRGGYALRTGTRTATPGYVPFQGTYSPGGPTGYAPAGGYAPPGWSPTNLPPTRAMGGRVPAYQVPNIDATLGGPPPGGDEMIAPRATPKTVIQDGQRYALQPDGTFVYVGPAQ